MTRLSVNINKVALIRNARGGNLPDIIKFASDCERFGAEGITVHPRPDERHIRFSDLSALKKSVSSEFNIEGNPTEHFIKEVLKIRPDQVTLVPDKPDALTSDTGWDVIKYGDYLQKIITRFHEEGIRVSIFLNPDVTLIEAAKATGTDRIELYTGEYAKDFPSDPEKAVIRHSESGALAKRIGLGVNAGHDLNLDNLAHYSSRMPDLLEVSIGHALICDALYYGIEDTIARYKECLLKGFVKNI